MPDIRITVDGRPAVTVALAAALTGRHRDTDVKHALRRAGLEPVARLDARTPLYLRAEALKALARPAAPTKEAIIAEIRRIRPDGMSLSALRVLRKAELERMLERESALSKGQDQ